MRVDTRATIASRLLAYYDRHARALPWRAPPGANNADPYRVWLSEIMLQQTTVAAVRPYFEAFTQRWPDVRALANADDAELMAAWAGLGYYARARNLLACARLIAGSRDGKFPQEEAELLRLPGVGAYTAAAISAIAFGRRAVVVDANVERVVARLFAIETPLPAARAAIRVAADAITPDTRAGDFAQAMMDLGATICTVRAPACGICPLREDCAAVRTADPAAFPRKAVKGVKPERSGHVWWIESAGAVWLERRPPKGLLGGMRGFPTSEWGASPAAIPPVDAEWMTLDGTVRHVFTHFALSLVIHRTIVARGALANRPGEWWPIGALEDAGLPTLFRKVANATEKEKDICR